jgi:hypothetical protein
VRVREREHGQEGNRLAANIAEPPPNPDPVMVFVVSLFAATAMTHDRIARTNGAPANDTFCGGLRPIGFRLALRGGKWDKDNRGNGGPAGGYLPRSQPEQSLRLPPKSSTGKEYRIPVTPAIRPRRLRTLAGQLQKEAQEAAARIDCRH